MTKVCVVTGSRAEYGLLYWPMKAIQEAFELQTIVTGAHLLPEFGMTLEQIEADGFLISERVPMYIGNNTTVDITKAMGQGLIGMADALERLKPDLLIILGDRYEMLVAASAALIAKIPVAHLCGGDTTEGAFDEAIRHSITKMSHIHFVSNALSEMRVRQLGENPQYIFNVGSPGIDAIGRMQYLSREAFFQKLGLTPRSRNVIVTYHPVTLGEDACSEIDVLLDVLATMQDVGVIITGANADTHGKALNSKLEVFAAQHGHVLFRISLGQELYLNALKHVDVVIGNSSSGLYEAPSFHIPTVNIGDRQKGRLQAASVINCQMEHAEIIRAIEQAFSMDCTDVINPYGDGHASERIISVLKGIRDFKPLIQKHFFMLEPEKSSVSEGCTVP